MMLLIILFLVPSLFSAVAFTLQPLPRFSFDPSKLKDFMLRAIQVSEVAECTNNVEKMLADGPIPIQEREFLINGWRWHTMSVIRDLNRFETVLSALEKQQLTPVAASSSFYIKAIDRVIQCNDFVVNFNWKALMKVETELFFPWLQTLLPNSAKVLFTEVYSQHSVIISLSSSLTKELNLLAGSKSGIDKTIFVRAKAVLEQLKESAGSIQSIQENVFVPYVSSYVSKSEQEKFNRRVIARLGLIDSQIHLVSMTEVIKGIPSEELKFRRQIPKVAQALIPLWKKRLYQKKANCLDDSWASLNKFDV